MQNDVEVLTIKSKDREDDCFKFNAEILALKRNGYDDIEHKKTDHLLQISQQNNNLEESIRNIKENRSKLEKTKICTQTQEEEIKSYKNEFERRCVDEMNQLQTQIFDYQKKLDEIRKRKLEEKYFKRA